MGCPDEHYIKALQYMQHALNWSKDKERAKRLAECTNITTLENEVLELKKSTDANDYIFCAGRVYEKVLTEADAECIDSFNASLGGLTKFMKLVGV